ncbi:MAG: hypothetical protein ACLS3F_03540 [Oscillospiraceae bacterium]
MIVRNVQFPGFERGRGYALGIATGTSFTVISDVPSSKTKFAAVCPGRGFQLDRKARRCISHLGGTELTLLTSKSSAPSRIVILFWSAPKDGFLEFLFSKKHPSSISFSALKFVVPS